MLLAVSVTFAQEFTASIDGLERSYKVYLPKNLKQGAPLVFVLHGYGANISHVQDKGFSEAAEKYGFAVCYPQGSKDGRGNPCWNVGYPFQADMKVDDVSFLGKLAAKLQNEYGLSRKNTFCTGMSNGGEMCYLLAYCGQTTFAAVAPIAGLTMAWMPEAFKHTVRIPLFEMHGTEDRVSEWTGDMENKGGWGAYIPVPDAVQYWVERNGCTEEIVEELPLKGEGAHKVITHKFVGKKDSPQVWLYEVVGGVHSWFNEDMDTADEVWKFFSQYLEEDDTYKYPSQERIDRQVDSVFRKLSTREKIAQIMVISFTSKDSKEMFKTQKRLVKKEKIGGLIPLGDVFVPAIEKLNKLNRLAKIPMLITLDAEWGASMRWAEIPAFQRFLQLGALSSDSLVYEVGKSIGKECRALKVQVNYSPVVDLNNNPHMHTGHTRSLGGSREKVARFSSAMMRGLHDGGVAGSAKHFPGHGDTDVDSHFALPLLPYSYDRLDSLELYPFKRLIADGIDMVMVGHLSIPALDSTGTPSSISKPVVTGLLREKLGFDGIICTDALNMHGVSKESGLEKKDIPLAAYKAGVDLLLMPEDVESSIDVIENALKSGEITMEGLDMRVKKMLALKARYGILEKGYDPIVDIDKLSLFTDTELKDGIMDKKLELIDKVSKETMTVVWNDNSAGYGLPVCLEGKKVAYVGFRNPQLGHEFGVMANRYGNVDTLLLGDGATIEDLKSARNRLKGHDLVIFGFNRTDLRLEKNYGIVPQEAEFITEWAAQQPMIAVYLGSPFAIAQIPDHRNFTAVVVGYMNNRVNNFAAAQVVFGGVPAKGVLPVTSGSYKTGESVIIPYRFREEYHHLLGSNADMENSRVYDMKESAPSLTLLPQVAELVACGKIRLSDSVGELLGADCSNASLSVEKLMAGYKDNDCSGTLKLLIGKFRPYISVEDTALQMIAKMGMRSTTISETVTTTGYDMGKYHFTLGNGGKYAGKQVMSSKAAELVLKFL